MKKTLLSIILFLVCGIMSFAQNNVRIEISDGLYNNNLKHKMENAASTLMSEINTAYSQNRPLKLSGMNLTDNAQQGLLSLWENTHFYCDDSEVVQSCISTLNGYQIRQIPLIIKPEGETLDDDYQEAVINFDKSGNIVRFNFTLSTAIYQNVMKTGKDVTEVARRQEILSYVERFRTAYNEKDLSFLQQIFSDDALIITGNVIKAKQSDGVVSFNNKVIYKKQSKHEYLSNLRRSFNANKWINVNFDEVKVRAHRKYEGFYGVTVHQIYSNSKGYSDDGYLFMLWDFRDRNNVQIHVRTWQPRWLNDEKTEELPETEIFTPDEFVINL